MSIRAALTTYAKKTGALAFAGSDMATVPLLPTGIFSFDLASGGGIPMGRISQVYGVESSGKSNFGLKAIQSHQRLYPEHECIVIDVEHNFDPVWARAMGVNTDKLLIWRPLYLEQISAFAEELILDSDDCGLILIDSVPAIMSARQFEDSDGKNFAGGASSSVKTMTQKILSSQQRVQREVVPTVLMINHISYKIGGYGNPETNPGGMALRFWTAMMIRLYGKNVVEKAHNELTSTYKHTSFHISKHRLRIYQERGEYLMAIHPDAPEGIGNCDDWKIVKAWLTSMPEEIGITGKTGAYRLGILDEEFKTYDAIRARLAEDVDAAGKVYDEIFKYTKEGGK